MSGLAESGAELLVAVPVVEGIVEPDVAMSATTGGAGLERYGPRVPQAKPVAFQRSHSRMASFLFHLAWPSI